MKHTDCPFRSVCVDRRRPRRPPGNPKSSYRTANGKPPADADEWLATTDEHRGTWWDHWVAWLQIWLHRIRTPVLVLSGDADPIVPPVNARILAARLPHAELEIVRGAGHLLLMERAPTVAARIAEFLAPEP